MEHMWEFFETLDEMVYVSDTETHELIYMNRHLRRALGYKDGQDYVGEKCYKLLQGSDTPCPFCTNCRLRPGEFVSWTHKNHVLNKRFLVKDILVSFQGRNYRIELAIDADSVAASKPSYYYARSETILNECLQLIVSSTDPESSIRNMLSYIGKTFSCDRTYIFEFAGENATNTYEWCAEGVAPQRELLQDVPLSAIDWWLALFAKNEVTILPDLEEIRTQHPEAYAILKPQDISSLAAGAIRVDGQVIGFLGVDNPDRQMLPLIAPLLNVIGYFTSTLLKRRDLLARLNELSYHDQLTGALNRHALAEQYASLSARSLGVVYCDITGLKQTNDTQGHGAGDLLIQRCYELLRSSIRSELIYRTGGDEFIVLCPDWEEDAFLQSLYGLQRTIRQDERHIAVGHVWSDDQPLNLEKLIIQAEGAMYQDKRDYYHENDRRPGGEPGQSQPPLPRLEAAAHEAETDF